ncbi:hypothetical protein R1sor_018545 [Riccia sorocarpa]|uniref:Glutaredoxin domain-containing protein n=1 Tax=Riccia sorocarpa TaxID=122646 RepID=A0ABD3I9Z7_9MARC
MAISIVASAPSLPTVSASSFTSSRLKLVVSSSCVSFSVPGSNLRALNGSNVGSRLSWQVGAGRRSGWTKRSSGLRKVCCAASSSSSVQKLGDVDSVELTNESCKGFPASPGVYAIFDKEGELQYIGISRRVSASIQSHLQDLPELCASAKVCVVDAQDKSALTEAWRLWIQEYVDTSGKVPPGNVQGNTTWTARKQRAAKPEIRLTPGPHVSLTIPLPELIDKVVKSCEVVAFVKGTRTAPQCGFSHRVLTILNEVGVDYEVVNVLDEHHNPGLREAIKQYSQWPTIPQIFVKGEFIGGADILDQLAQSGELKTVFQKS